MKLKSVPKEYRELALNTVLSHLNSMVEEFNLDDSVEHTEMKPYTKDDKLVKDYIEGIETWTVWEDTLSGRFFFEFDVSDYEECRHFYEEYLHFKVVCCSWEVET